LRIFAANALQKCFDGWLSAISRCYCSWHTARPRTRWNYGRTRHRERSERGCQKVGRELLRPLAWVMVMMQITNNAWKDRIRQIAEEDSAAY
jgi:hypothetical protein